MTRLKRKPVVPLTIVTKKRRERKMERIRNDILFVFVLGLLFGCLIGFALAGAVMG